MATRKNNKQHIEKEELLLLNTDINAIEKEFVEGNKTADGNTVYPSFAELCNKHGIDPSILMQHIDISKWQYKRSQSMEKIEKRKNYNSLDIVKDIGLLYADTYSFLAKALQVDQKKFAECAKSDNVRDAEKWTNIYKAHYEILRNIQKDIKSAESAIDIDTNALSDINESVAASVLKLALKKYGNKFLSDNGIIDIETKS